MKRFQNNVGATDFEGRDLASCPFPEATAEQRCWASCDPRSHVETADLRPEHRVSRGLFKRTDSGAPPKSGGRGLLSPGSHGYLELATGLSALSLAAWV